VGFFVFWFGAGWRANDARESIPDGIASLN
jgi:hypothetical protein